MALADLEIRCACGAVRAVARGISGDRGNHVVCYCDDCQAFARHLGAADRVLDAHGGSEIFQLSPARLELRAGIERLACLRLRPGGLLRWYASCCRTPIGNTLASRQLPFVGLVLSRVDDAQRRARDAALGPVLGRFQARFAVGDRTQLDAHDGVAPGLMLRLLRQTIVARLRGEHARSPFFTSTGDPVATPRVLNAEELAAAQPPTARARTS